MIPLFFRPVRVSYRFIPGGGIGNSGKSCRLIHRQIFCRFIKIILACSLYPVTIISIEIRIAINFHDILFGILFFQLLCQNDFHNFTGIGSLRAQKSIFDHLLGDCRTALRYFSPILQKLQKSTQSRFIIHSVVAHKLTVLLCDIGMLKVGRNLINAVIHKMSGIDSSQRLSFVIQNQSIGSFCQVLQITSGKLFIRTFTQPV